MYDINSKKISFDSNSTSIDATPSRIYVMQPDTGKEKIENHDLIQDINNAIIEEYHLTATPIKTNRLDSRLRNDDGYNYDNLHKIMDNEYKRDNYGNFLGKAYDNEESLMNDLNKLDQIYKDFPGFKYYNQVLYDEAYGSYNIKEAGCCPTCLAMVLTYLTKDNVLPTDLTDTMSKYLYPDGTDVTGNCYYDTCSKYNIKPTMLNWQDKTEVQQALETNKPLILNVSTGNFTGSGHYIVLLGLDDKGDVIVADPNNINTSVQSYSLDSLLNQTHQIGAACWSFEV